MSAQETCAEHPKNLSTCALLQVISTGFYDILIILDNMPKPEPFWQKWKKDPKKAERLYYLYWTIVIGTNLMILGGAIMFFVILYWK